MPSSPPRWNIFARELEDILAAHGCRLGHLDDRAGIHRQKVARLQHSLVAPKFHVLTPEEVERVAAVFQFTGDEVVRLRAAILATAIEDMLMNRIAVDDALVAADHILPIIYAALKVNVEQPEGLGMVRGGNISAYAFIVTPQSDLLDPAIVLIERGVLAAHLVMTAMANDCAQAHRQLARASFRDALTTLHALPEIEQACEGWKYWEAEAKRALKQAVKQGKQST